MSTTGQVIAENNEGVVSLRGNELCVDSKITRGDAAALRVGAPYVAGESGGGGLIGFDVLESSRKCVALITAGQDQHGGGELTIHVLKRGGASVDADMLKAIQIREGQIEFNFPISAPNFGGGGGETNRLFSVDGRLMWQLQNDGPWAERGAIIVYNRQVPGLEGQWTATGKLVPVPL